MKATKATPTTAQTSPTGAKSNILKGASSVRARICEMMMLGGVPMRVTMPPRMVAKASGISVRPGPRPALRAACMSTGIRSASAATLFMKADSTEPMPPIMAMWPASPLPAPDTWRVMKSTAPELTSPRETTSTSATMMVASLPNPANASSAGTAPAATPISSAAKATRSNRQRPHSISAKTQKKMAKRTVWSKVMKYPGTMKSAHDSRCAGSWDTGAIAGPSHQVGSGAFGSGGTGGRDRSVFGTHP